MTTSMMKGKAHEPPTWWGGNYYFFFFKFVTYMMIKPQEDLAKFGYKWDMKKIKK
jgi:hypothetical protein